MIILNLIIILILCFNNTIIFLMKIKLFKHQLIFFYNFFSLIYNKLIYEK